MGPDISAGAIGGYFTTTGGKVFTTTSMEQTGTAGHTADLEPIYNSAPVQEQGIEFWKT